MKIWITGASGLLGRALQRELALRAPAWKVLLTSHSRPLHGAPGVDLLDRAAVEKWLEDSQPDVILNLAAERRPDVVEANPETSRALNAVVPGFLAEAGQRSGAWLLHLSTDYVFDGTAAPYKPSAPTSPLNEYGRNKSDAEVAVRQAVTDAIILRVPILYGDTDDLAESAATIVAADLLALPPDAKLTLDDWSTRFPTHIDDVAIVLRQLIEHRQAQPDFCGIMHWSGNQPYTKYGMGCVMADALGIPRERMIANPNPGTGTPRPRDCQLDCSDLEEIGIGRHTPFVRAINDLLKKHAAKTAAAF